MKISIGLVCYLLFLMAGFAVSAGADTRYVSDQLTVTLRKGEGTEYKIIKTLRTGTPVEVLEENEHYLKVRTQSGEEGYVLKQYLSTETPKALVVAQLQKERDRLRSKLSEVEKRQAEVKTELENGRKNHAAEVNQLKRKLTELQDRLLLTEKQLQATTDKYNDLVEKAENVVELASEHDKLQSQNTQFVAEVQALRKENEQMLHSGMIRWFVAGGGVLFVGWLSGKFSRKKRSSF
jgi:SH3 domain protein